MNKNVIPPSLLNMQINYFINVSALRPLTMAETKRLKELQSIKKTMSKQTKYILCGSEAVNCFNSCNYRDTAKEIHENRADIFEISDLNDIAELLEQLRGWDNFIEVSSDEQLEIELELKKLKPHVIYVNVYRHQGTNLPFVKNSFLDEEVAKKIGSKMKNYIKTVAITDEV